MSKRIYMSFRGRKAAPKPYRYVECGLDNIYLRNGFKIHETPYGRGVSFENLRGLHKAIVRALFVKKGWLEPQEFRFLRNHLKLTQGEFADLIGTTRQNIGRWERGDTDDIPGPADRLARLCAVAEIRTKDELLTVLEKAREPEPEPEPEWRERMAA